VDQPLPLVLRKKLNELASTAKNEGGTLTRIRSALPQSTPALAELRKKNEGGRCSRERGFVFAFSFTFATTYLYLWIWI